MPSDQIQVIGVAGVLLTLVVLLCTLKANRDAADAAIQSANVAVRALRLQQQPLIVADQMRSLITLEPGINRIVLWLKNIGGGIARDIEGYAASELVVDGATYSKLNGPASAPPSRLDSGPGQQHPIFIPTRAFTADDLRLIRDATLRLYVYGWYTYRDAFGCSYYLEFCLWHEPNSGALLYCPEHNSPGEMNDCEVTG